MTPCDEFVEALSGAPSGARASDDALPDALRQHADGCPACGALRAVDAQLHAVAGATAPLEPSAALRELLAAPVRPAAPFSPLRRAFVPAAATVLLGAAALRFVPRHDLPGQSCPRYWAVAALWLAAVFAALALVLARGRSGLGLPPQARWAFVGVATAAFVLVSWLTTHPVEGSYPGAVTAGLHLHCAAVGSALAALVGAAVFAVARRTAAVSPPSAGAAGGAAGGFAAALALHVVCHVAAPSHVALGHAAPVVLGAVVGALAGRSALAP